MSRRERVEICFGEPLIFKHPLLFIFLSILHGSLVLILSLFKQKVGLLLSHRALLNLATPLVATLIIDCIFVLVVAIHS